MIAAKLAAKVELYLIVSLRCFSARLADFKPDGTELVPFTVSALPHQRVPRWSRTRVAGHTGCRRAADFTLTVGPNHKAQQLSLCSRQCDFERHPTRERAAARIDY